MKKRVNLKSRVSALIMSFFLASGLIAPALSFEVKAEALPNVLESSATVADCVMSYYAMSGSAVANVEWINTLYESLGSTFGTMADFADDGLMFFEDGVWKPAEQLVQNIANTSAYTSLGLDTVFNVSAEEVQNGGGIAVATGASTLAGACGSVASTGVLPVLGGVTVAYWGGIGLGTIIAHELGLYDKKVYNSQPITFTDNQMNQIAGGSSIAKSKFRNNNTQYMVYSDEVRVFWLGYMNSTKLVSTLVFFDNSKPSQSFNWHYSYNNNGSWQTPSNASYTLNSKGVYLEHKNNDYYDKDYSIPLKLYSTQTDYQNAINNLRDNGISDYVPYSPDLIGEDGNLIGNKDSNGKIIIPDMKPQIDPQTQSGKPLSLQDWLQFANGVQNNNNSTSPLPDNTSLFQDILDAIKAPLPTPGPNPGENPGVNPGGETYPVPGPVPNPSPVPDPEYQPETKPQPQYTEKATENETDIREGDPWTTPDLLDKFPFCIPRDVYRVFTKLDSGARAAPHIQWRFNPNSMIDYTFDIDFSEWDNIATLLRTLELLGFIVALAVATRKMILS